MVAAASPSPAQMHFFFFNVHPPLPVLQPFSSSQFNDGVEPVLKQHVYVLVPGTPAHIKLYCSDHVSDRYLAIMDADGQRYIFHIHDDESLDLWRHQYEQLPPMFLAKKLLPPPAAQPSQVSIPMNLKVLKGR
jgi:hypothetical protein